MILIYIIYLYRQRSTGKKIGNPALVNSLIKGYSPVKRHLKFVLIVVVFLAAIITLANPRQQGKGSPDLRNGIDLVIALDVSKSMLATDLNPDRLHHAKEFLRSVVKNRPDDRIGLVLFAGHAYTQLPLTYDHSSAELFILNADPKTFTAQGTAIGDALEKSRDMLLSETRRFRVILLVTDGETFDENAEDGNAMAWAEECAKSGIMINTIGIGSQGGSTIMDPLTKTPKKDRNGNVVTTALNAKLLTDIAAKTNGSFVFYISPEDATSKILNKVSTVQQTALVDQSLISYNTIYHWLAFPLVLLMLAEFFIPERKSRS